MSPLRPSFHQTPLLSSFLVCPFGTVNPTLADRSRGYFIFIRPPKLYGLSSKANFLYQGWAKAILPPSGLRMSGTRQIKG